MARSAKDRSERKTKPSVHGEAFEAHLQDLLGESSGALIAALGTVSPTSIRINPVKWVGPQASPIPWCATGRYLDQRPAFTFDPLLHAGAYYVQEASSMLVEQAVRAAGLQGRDVLALDLCAAPGGKTTHLCGLLGSGSLLVANEIDRKRRSVLQENLWKWGASNTVLGGSAPSDLKGLPSFFDLILVDAPCSGEGMFRKDPFAREQWSPALVEQCTLVQRDILQHAWNALRPGGHLIYSTCTWEEAENEEQLAALVDLGAVCVPVPVDPTWGMVRSTSPGINAVRSYPHLTRGEGFFIAVLRKPGEAAERLRSKHTEPQEHAQVLTWLGREEHWVLTERDGVLYATDAQWGPTLTTLTNALRILSPGVPVAERKGGEWRPHPALALSTALNKDAFQHIAVGRAGALDYLRGASLPAVEAKGTGLIMHDGCGLGWAQGAGSRWNNRWPTPWRIRAHQPSAPLVSWARSS
ncbi:MAG: hypothetical protein KDC00_09025 [Flavobacteriales bacterium]|nr:hypothetical protein [Flavobacteriales bacterium]